jgi:uncharacterized Zn finger protein (UPF0148 family)
MNAACPKCGSPKTDAVACPRCGVVFARFDAAALDAGVPDALKALWAHAEAGWEERARHALFTERAIADGFAAYAAARYRARGPDDPIAAEQLERITARLEQALAHTSMATGARGDHPSRRIGAIYLLAILLFLVVGALGIALVLR